MRRTFKYLLRPTTGQEIALIAMLDDHRAMYNAALQERRDAYRMCKVSIRYGDQSAQLKDIRRADPDGLGRWSFSSQQATLRRLNRAFDAFFRRVKAGQTPGFPRFKGAGWFDTVEWPTDRDGCRWDSVTGQHRVYLQGVGHVRVHQHRPVVGTIKTISVKREGRCRAVRVLGRTSRCGGAHMMQPQPSRTRLPGRTLRRPRSVQPSSLAPVSVGRREGNTSALLLPLLRRICLCGSCRQSRDSGLPARCGHGFHYALSRPCAMASNGWWRNWCPTPAQPTAAPQPRRQQGPSSTVSPSALSQQPRYISAATFKSMAADVDTAKSVRIICRISASLNPWVCAAHTL